MKITLIGSLGNITKPLAKNLIEKGHQVTVISSNQARAEEIKALGAKPAIGKLDDVDFLISAFTGADAVYTMVPPDFSVTNFRLYIAKTGEVIAEAIKRSAVKKVVNLSSVGADLPNGTGPIAGLYDVEHTFEQLDADVKHLRAAYFYINLLANIDMVKHAGILGSNFSADSKIVLVHPTDIAEVAADELESEFTGKSVRYVASTDDHVAGDLASSIGSAIDKPDLPWIEFTDEQALKGMIDAGLPEEIAKNYVEMGTAIRSGKIFEDYFKHKPSTLGAVKLVDFAKDFASAYHQ